MQVYSQRNCTDGLRFGRTNLFRTVCGHKNTGIFREFSQFKKSMISLNMDKECCSFFCTGIHSKNHWNFREFPNPGIVIFSGDNRSTKSETSQTLAHAEFDWFVGRITSCRVVPYAFSGCVNEHRSTQNRDLRIISFAYSATSSCEPHSIYKKRINKASKQ